MNERKTNSIELAIYIFSMAIIGGIVFGNWLFQWMQIVFPVVK